MSSITPPTPQPSFFYTLVQQQQQQQQEQGQQHSKASWGYQQQRTDQDMSANSIMLLDVATIQGLLLYTIYLLHRLRFFQWRDVRKLTAFCHRQVLKVQSSSSLSSTLKSLQDKQTDRDLDQKVVEDMDQTNSHEEDGMIRTESEVDVAASDTGAKLDVSMIPVVTTPPSLLPKNGDEDGTTRSLDPALVIAAEAMVESMVKDEVVLSNAVMDNADVCVSINDKLPPEILSLVFAQLARCTHKHHPHAHRHHNKQKTRHLPPLLQPTSRTLLRCMLVCQSWYALIAPVVWKSPRVLWSRHWSKFFPVCVTMKDTRISGSSSSSSSSSTLILSSLSTTMETAMKAARATTTTTLHTMAVAAAAAATTAIEGGAQYDGLEVETVGRDIHHPTGVAQELEQEEWHTLVEHQDLSRTELEGLLASGQLIEKDRQELEHWLRWRKRERKRRIRQNQRRREQKQTQQQQQQQQRDRRHVTESSAPEANGGMEEGDLRTGSRVNDEICSESETEYEEEENDYYNNGFFHYDPSDDETPLMKLVAGFDSLCAMVRSGHSSSPKTPEASTPRSFLLNVMDRVRRHQAAKHARRRLAKLRPSDGLPVAFPLQSIGHWIQVMNLQQETPFPQRPCSQVLLTHHHHYNHHYHHHILGSVQPLTTARDHLRRLHHHPQRYHHQQEIGATSLFELEEPDSLPTRRDFVTDRTLKTILEHCPNLRRLTISECRGITDRGMQFLREAPCVTRGTLVSLHMATCYRITDQGLLNLVSAHRPSQKADGVTTTETLDVPRFESLDLAGCFQISDRGLVPLLEQCGTRLLQLRVSDCEKVSFDSVMALARHCPSIQWLDLARSGTLTEECLIQLSEQCPDLEWLNLARQNPNEPSSGTSSSENQEEQEEEDEEEEEEEENSGSADVQEDEDEVTSEVANEGEDIGEQQDPISDRAIARLCESCPRLQLLDLSYITTITNTAIESMSESATSLVCLTIIGCSGITTLSLTYLSKLRSKSGRLGCITMGDALGISEKDIEKIMEDTLSGWQKSFVEETNMGDILGRSWDE
ncbi:MAG: hypothetical protein J3Q66DRAFT_175305 [Benniella sp.]|nr:MAG: hypothetical protein J3Q66DRAFT_175305 [Benniella sp.]